MIPLSFAACVKAPPTPPPPVEVTLPVAYAKDLLLGKNALAVRLNTLKREAALYKSSIQEKKDLRDEDYVMLNMAYNLTLNQTKVLAHLIDVLDGVLLKNKIEMGQLKELLTETSRLANEPRIDTLVKSVRERFEEQYQKDDEREFDSAENVSRDQKDFADIYTTIRKNYGSKNFDQVLGAFEEHDLKDKGKELPTDVAVIYGLTLLNKGNAAAAADWLVSSLSSADFANSPDLTSGKIALAEAYIRLGKEAKAKGVYEELLSRQKQSLKQVKELAALLAIGADNQNGSSISGETGRLIEAETLLLTERDLEKAAKICNDIIRTNEGSPDATKAKSLLKSINQKLEPVIETELQEIARMDRGRRGGKLKNLVQRFHLIWPSDRIRTKVYDRVRAEDVESLSELGSDEAKEIVQRISQSLPNLRLKNELIAARNEIKNLRHTEYDKKALEWLKEVDDRIAKIIRNEAAKMFLESEKISDSKKRVQVLKSAYKMLVTAQIDYPWASIIDKLKKNAEYVLIEIKKLDPNFDG